ncbi:hypothetical protein [Pseudomonas syringae]|uniref:Head-to-tail stopper n=1 Tax=Pseudomonas syringae CC1417 TaxID=1357272 RepID=A0AAU8LFB0_PSESX
MADIYDRSKALAVRMLAPRDRGGKGAALTLVKSVKGQRDPDTGVATEVVTNYPGSGLRETYNQRDIDNTNIKVGDVKFLVSPVLIDQSDMPQPASSDKIQFGGKVYSVIQVSPWNYAGLAVGFEVQARS